MTFHKTRGNNAQGQCGDGSEKKRLFGENFIAPTKIPFPKENTIRRVRCLRVACGATHTLAVCEYISNTSDIPLAGLGDQRCFSWGENFAEENQESSEKEEPYIKWEIVRTPKRILFPPSSTGDAELRLEDGEARIIHIGCGEESCCCVVEILTFPLRNLDMQSAKLELMSDLDIL